MCCWRAIGLGGRGVPLLCRRADRTAQWWPVGQPASAHWRRCSSKCRWVLGFWARMPRCRPMATRWRDRMTFSHSFAALFRAWASSRICCCIRICHYSAACLDLCTDNIFICLIILMNCQIQTNLMFENWGPPVGSQCSNKFVANSCRMKCAFLSGRCDWIASYCSCSFARSIKIWFDKMRGKCL